MPIPVQCTCGASYSLKDEFAGQRVRCPSCGAEIPVGTPAPGSAPAVTPGAPGVDPVFQRDKFLLRQQHFAISEKYYVNDEQGNPIIFVQRPLHFWRNLGAMLVGVVAGFTALGLVIFLISLVESKDSPGWLGAIGVMVAFFAWIGVTLAVGVALSAKRHIVFYSDDTKAQQLLEVLQDQRWQIPTATYTLRDTTGKILARFSKNFLYDIFRKRWVITNPSGYEIAKAKEDSIILSMLRRFLGPLFGALRTNFVIVRGEDDQVIGEFNRKFTLLDRYVLDMSADRTHVMDRRVALALGVLLDTGERR